MSQTQSTTLQEAVHPVVMHPPGLHSSSSFVSQYGPPPDHVNYFHLLKKARIAICKNVEANLIAPFVQAIMKWTRGRGWGQYTLWILNNPNFRYGNFQCWKRRQNDSRMGMYSTEEQRKKRDECDCDCIECCFVRIMHASGFWILPWLYENTGVAVRYWLEQQRYDDYPKHKIEMKWCFHNHPKPDNQQAATGWIDTTAEGTDYLHRMSDHLEDIDDQNMED